MISNILAVCLRKTFCIPYEPALVFTESNTATILDMSAMGAPSLHHSLARLYIQASCKNTIEGQ